MTIAVILSKLQKTSRHTFDLATLFSQNGNVVGNTNRTTGSSTILQDSLTANGRKIANGLSYLKRYPCPKYFL